MPQVIPITLSPVPVPLNAVAESLSQLVALVAQYLEAEIQSDVSFFLSVTSDPATDQGVIIYNSVQNVFKAWNGSLGKYLPIGFLFVDTLPTTDQGYFYNTANNSFYYWNGTSYSAVTSASAGDVLFNYNNADELTRGYVLAAGSRTIDSIAALTTNQNAALHTLFGLGAAIQVPNITAPTSTVGGGGGGGATLYPKIFCGLT